MNKIGPFEFLKENWLFAIKMTRISVFSNNHVQVGGSGHYDAYEVILDFSNSLLVFKLALNCA